MSRPNLQRLVTVFLLLAFIASSLIFIISTYANNPSQSNVASENPGNPSAKDQNAFVESLNSVPTISPAVAGNSANLTNLLAQNLIEQIIANNPNGPQQTTDGGYILNTPSDSLVAKLTDQVLSQNQIKIDENVSEQDIKIIANPTSQDGINYVNSLASILNGISANEDLSRLTNESTGGPELDTAAETAFQGAFEKLLAIEVPTPFEGLHLGILKTLADQRKIYELAGEYQTDPIKSFLAIQNSNKVLLRDLEDLKNNLNQTSEAQPKIYALLRNLPLTSFLETILTIKTALAAEGGTGGGGGTTGPLPNPTGSACGAITALTAPIRTLIGNLGQQISNKISSFFQNAAGNAISSFTGAVQAPTSVPVNLTSETAPSAIQRTANSNTLIAQSECNWLYDVVLQQVKNTLINELQNELVNWIQGGGKPLFITNWRQFLANVANVALGNSIYQIAPYLCTGISPLVQIAIQAPPYAYTPVYCTLNQVISNVQNFYNSFSSGGWIAYSYSLEPQGGNIFGTVLQASLIVNNQVEAETTAANTEAQANGGFLAQKICVQSYTDPGTRQKICEEYKNVTPGQAVAHALFASEDWVPQEIISAQRFEQLVAAITDALINRLIRGTAGLLGTH